MNRDLTAIDAEIISRTDVEAVAVECGIVFAGDCTNEGDWRPCHAIGRDDKNASAAINVASNGHRGQYTDLGGTEKAMGFFEWTGRLKFAGDWKKSREHYAKLAGVELPNGKAKWPNKTKGNPADALEFKPWSSNLCWYLKSHKEGISEAALLEAGARQARYQGHTVFALPILGESLNPDHPVGYVVFDVFGNELPVYSDGKIVRTEKIKSVYGSTSGFVGVHSARLKSNEVLTVIKCEGPTDMLAAMTATPEHLRASLLFVSNNAGCKQSPEWMADPLAKFPCIVSGDADKPGQFGAARWANDIAAEQSEELTTRNVQLPYPVEEKKGKDLRDWICDGHTIEEFLQLADATDPIVGAKRRKRKADIANFETFIESTPEGKKTITEPLSMEDIIDDVYRLNDVWPRRVGSCPFIDDPKHGIGLFDKSGTEGFFGWLRRNHTVEWKRGGKFVSPGQLFAEISRTAKRYEAIELLPHEPPLDGIYYRCQAPPAGDGKHLNALLDRFRPETTIDRDLLLAAIVTPFAGLPPGCRPAFVYSSDAGRGAGKTKAAESAAQLAGGFIDVSANEDMTTLKQRFLSPEGMTKRVAMLDNVKSPRMSWAELEALVTTRNISGKQMYVGEQQRPNLLTWFITLNGVSLATDMAQRSVIIKLAKGENDATWYESTIRYIEEHRQAIIGDIIAILRSEPYKLASYSRWAAWEAAVLCRLPEPEEAQRVILERQAESNTDLDEGEIVEGYFADQLQRLGYAPDRAQVRIPVAVAARWFNWATNEQMKTMAVTRRLKQMAAEKQLHSIASDAGRTHGRCFIWTGENADYQNSLIENDLNLRITEFEKRKQDR